MPDLCCMLELLLVHSWCCWAAPACRLTCISCLLLPIVIRHEAKRDHSFSQQCCLHCHLAALVAALRTRLNNTLTRHQCHRCVCNAATLKYAVQRTSRGISHGLLTKSRTYTLQFAEGIHDMMPAQRRVRAPVATGLWCNNKLCFPSKALNLQGY